MQMRYTLFWILVFFLSACNTPNYKAFYGTSKKDNLVVDTLTTRSRLLHQFYLVGDAGEGQELSGPVLDLLKHSLDNEAAQKTSVVFLGDNLYPAGLHAEGTEERQADEAKLMGQVNAVKDFDGRVVFIPGNHDWNKGHEGGWEQLKRQEAFIEEKLGRDDVFLPENGCPGPELIEISEDLGMLVIDSQWWMHSWDKPRGEKDGCEAANKLEFMEEVKDVLKKYRNKNLIVVAHHPVFSNGEHGGHFMVRDHLFPLTNLNKSLYIPLPIIGSNYPATRRFLGHPQDLVHPIYAEYVKFIRTAFDSYENLVYVAGHEHNIQYKEEKKNHFIVSGAGSKSTHLARNKDIDFGTEAKGVTRIAYYENGECWLEVLQAYPKVSDKVIYRKKLYTKEQQTSIRIPEVTEWPDSVAVIPDYRYAASKAKRLFFGDLHRDLWTTPLQVPVFDMDTTAGGLIPLRMGGGMQTRSLRLVNAKGQQYVLRTVDKSAAYLVSSDLRNTIAQDVLHDGISGSHPYAALVVSPMAEALGIYHTNPRLVYVPDSPNLGDFQEVFGGRFCLFEEKPKGDMSHVASMGHAPKVFSSSKAFDKVQSKYKHKFDKDYIVKARLLDMILGDWDRHDGQWKWRTMKKGKFTYYQPIPVDRDQVFFTFDGLIPSLTNRQWFFRKFQTYGPKIRDIIGQNYNARYFDRTVLTEASKEDWLKAAQLIKEELTDEIIDEALALLPKEAQSYKVDFFRESLKKRRDNIDQFALEYYEVLAEEVEVCGTTKDDYFDISRINDDEVLISIHALKNGEKKKAYYRRVFNRKETKEIRVFGIGGSDTYNIEGEVRKSIKIRLIGGKEKDTYADHSKVARKKHQAIIYEKRNGDDSYFLTTQENRKILTSTRDLIQYDRKAFKYNTFVPVISIGANPNDKFFIGGGFKSTKYGFNRSPYKTMHKLVANISPVTQTFNIYYDFDYTERLGKWSIAGNVEINDPLNFNYYGLGNESKEPPRENRDQYRIFLNRILLQPYVHRRIFNGMGHIKLGVTGFFYDFLDDEGENPLVPADVPLADSFIGAFFEYRMGNVDNKAAPNKGAVSVIRLGINESINEHLPNTKFQDDYNYIHARSSFYNKLTFLPIDVVAATQIGFKINIGDYPFYLSNFLDGTSNFRGVWRNRYAGKKMLHLNNDLRIKVAKIRNYLVPFDIGLIGHYDLGRVWLRGNPSKVWHQSYGAGVYVNIIDAFVLTATQSYTIRGNQAFLFGTSFFF